MFSFLLYISIIYISEIYSNYYVLFDYSSLENQQSATSDRVTLYFFFYFFTANRSKSCLSDELKKQTVSSWIFFKTIVLNQLFCFVDFFLYDSSTIYFIFIFYQYNNTSVVLFWREMKKVDKGERAKERIRHFIFLITILMRLILFDNKHKRRKSEFLCA